MPLTVSVIMPALNEAKNVGAAIADTLQAMDDYAIEGEIIVVNDGSTDETEARVRDAMDADPRVRLTNHPAPKGIGASFWEGVAAMRGDIVTMLPGDNENFPHEILRYVDLLQHVDIVIPFLFDRGVRTAFRKFLSVTYRTIINVTFLVNFNYTNGTVLYRRSVLEDIEYQSTGFFFQTDILIRSVKKGYLFAEVPYKIRSRKSGKSKAMSFPSFLQVVRGYMRL